MMALDERVAIGARKAFAMPWAVCCLSSVALAKGDNVAYPPLKV